MNPLVALGVVVAVGVPTYLMRGGLILALGARRLPPVAERALRNVGPAVMAALVVNLVAGGEEGFDGVTVAQLAALTVAVLVGLWKRNVVVTLAAGMVTLWVFDAVV